VLCEKSQDSNVGSIAAEQSYLLDGYLMIKALKLNNFRCFKEIELHNLRRVNVVVGKNAAGKTALLEAIKLGLDGLPATLPWLNQMRSILAFIPGPATAEIFQGLFRDFFYEFDTEKPIEIWMQDSAQQSATLRVYFDAKRATTIQMSMGFQKDLPSPNSLPSTIIPLAFERSDFQEQKSTLYATVDEDGKIFLEPAAKSLGVVSGFFSNSNFGNPPESASWLSNLSVEKRSREVISAVQRHFPFIKELTSESPILGLGATVYADVDTLPRKLPLSLLSGGISRLFAIMLAIVTFRGGAILIDEIENGIFYDQYPMVWKTLIDLAEEHKTQLFISTHSNECLQALLPSIRGSENDFVLLRAERENGVSHIAQFTGKEFEGALAKGGEIRKP